MVRWRASPRDGFHAAHGRRRTSDSRRRSEVGRKAIGTARIRDLPRCRRNSIVAQMSLSQQRTYRARRRSRSSTPIAACLGPTSTHRNDCQDNFPGCTVIAASPSAPQQFQPAPLDGSATEQHLIAQHDRGATTPNDDRQCAGRRRVDQLRGTYPLRGRFSVSAEEHSHSTYSEQLIMTQRKQVLPTARRSGAQRGAGLQIPARARRSDRRRAHRSRCIPCIVLMVL